MSVLAAERAAIVNHASRCPNFEDVRVRDTLEISESRTYDCALEILGAYKLTGNFPLDLEIVLESLGVLGQVTFAITPKSMFSDTRRVDFLVGGNADPDRFRDILRRIESRIGSDPTPLSWRRLFHKVRRGETAS